MALRPVIALGLFALAACSGVGSEAQLCSEGYKGGLTFIFDNTLACPGCSTANLRQAIDGSMLPAELFFSFAEVTPSGGEMSLQAIRGARFFGTKKPGAYLRFPQNVFASYVVSISVALDGDEVETINCTVEGGQGGCAGLLSETPGAGDVVYFGGTTSAEFDEVRLSIQLLGATAPVRVEVNEICASQ